MSDHRLRQWLYNKNTNCLLILTEIETCTYKSEFVLSLFYKREYTVYKSQYEPGK